MFLGWKGEGRNTFFCYLIYQLAGLIYSLYSYFWYYLLFGAKEKNIIDIYQRIKITKRIDISIYFLSIQNSLMGGIKKP